MSKKPLEIDILKMEIEEELPHWLSQAGGYIPLAPERVHAIREKHRARHRVEQMKRNPKHGR